MLDFSQCDEQTEFAFRSAIKGLQRTMSPEEYHQFVVDLALEHQEWLRRNYPNHPLLAVLD